MSYYHNFTDASYQQWLAAHTPYDIYFGISKPTNWEDWKNDVRRIANYRGIAIREVSSFPSTLFFWEDSAHPYINYGTSLAHPDDIRSISPYEFTFNWSTMTPPDIISSEKILRRGRFVRRIPARAVSMAMIKLF